MNLTAFACAAIVVVGTSYAVELRQTQFPAKLPKTIIVAGADRPAVEVAQPWVTRDPSEYSGEYVSRTITDGIAKLTVKMHQAKSSEGDVRWHVAGTLETKCGVGVAHTMAFQNAELMEPKQPCFDVIDRVTPGLFVWFTDPDLKEKKPAVVIGDQIFAKR